jgi:spermidine synthase
VTDYLKLQQALSTGHRHEIDIKAVLASGSINGQSYQICDLADFGRAMVIDGYLQSCAGDEALYHEALLAPAVSLAPRVRNVLLVGGANGGLVNRLGRLPGIRNILQVDIERNLYEISCRLLPHMHAGDLGSVEVQRVFGDPIAEIRRLGPEYRGWADVIIADLPDATPGSYAEEAFRADFQVELAGWARPEGILAIHAGQAILGENLFLADVCAALRAAHGEVALYWRFIPSLAVPWLFCIASPGNNLNSAARERRLRSKRSGFYLAAWSTLTAEGLLDLFAVDEAFRQSFDAHSAVDSSVSSSLETTFQNGGAYVP